VGVLGMLQNIKSRANCSQGNWNHVPAAPTRELRLPELNGVTGMDSVKPVSTANTKVADIV
jgi:hypothetical protein